MKYLQLVWATLARRKIGSVLTLLSIVAAFLLFGLLDTVRITFVEFGQSAAGDYRLETFSKTSPGAPLPLGLYARIREVPGVGAVEYAYSFGGTYQDPKNAIPIEAHSEAVFSIVPGIELSESARAAFGRIRTGALIGENLARKFGWKVGDKIPLKTSVVNQEGSDVWTFDVAGIYRHTERGMRIYDNKLIINWEFFEQARQFGKGTVTYYQFSVTNLDEVDRVAQAIDELSANSDHETKTQSGNAFSADLIRQRGDLGLIVVLIMGAVFFALLLVTGHTMAHSVQERIPDLAVLKTIGFTGRRIMGLVLGESVFLLLLGSVIGLGAATLGVVEARSVLESTLQLPMAPIGSSIWLRGLTVAVAIGLIVGLLPALRGLRLRVVDALSCR